MNDCAPTTAVHRRLIAFAVLPLLSAACARQVAPPDTAESHVPGHPAVSGAAAGSALELERVQMVKFENVERYPARFICGTPGPTDAHAPGTYFTTIEVFNITKFLAKAGYFISLPGTGWVGAGWDIQPFSSTEFDCDWIMSALISHGFAPGSFQEGFLMIQPQEKTPLVVHAAYSLLHKQLHDRPDLIPVPTNGRYCVFARGGLLVTIRNQGDTDAEPSSTSVVIGDNPPQTLATPALPAGGQAALPPVDFGTGEGTFPFTIKADAPEAIQEVNEMNNEVSDFCGVTH